MWKKQIYFAGKTKQNTILPKNFICLLYFTDYDFLKPPSAASSDIKFKRLFDNNGVSSIYQSAALALNEANASRI